MDPRLCSIIDRVAVPKKVVLTHYTSTVSWSISFYPQPLLNWRRRSTSGFTVDFAILNVVGFLCYTISTAAFLFSPTIIHQYAVRHPLAPEPTVRVNDLAFAAHALGCCLLVVSQFWYRLWGFAGESARASPPVIGIICGSAIGVGIVGTIVWTQQGHDNSAWLSIDIVCDYCRACARPLSSPSAHWRLTKAQIYALSYVKLLITFTKYLPQALANYKAQSTKGWAIETILLDLIGGVLSLAQLCIDSALQADWTDGIKGNPVKFLLSIVSLLFDFIFIAQHYLLYPRAHGRPDDERAPLLG